MKMAKRVLAVLLAAILAFGSLGTAAFASDKPGQEAAIASPEVQPEITAEPVIEATEEPAPEATEEPAVEATEEPVVEVPEEPVVEATEEPAVEATEEPAPEATEEPAEEPETEEPEEEPEEAEPETATAGQTAKYYNPSAGMEMTAYNVTTVTNSTTSWTEGWYEVQGSVTMDTVTVSGNVHLILPHATSLRVTKGGIQIKGGGSLTIWGTESDYNSDGTLTATGEELYAGIGLMKWNSDAKVTINGGVVSGTGGYDGGAGIGGAYGASGVTVTINGGSVYGRSGYDGGAGIGTGNYGNNTTVTINGGTVNAKSFEYGAAIGAGGYSDNATVTINGGTVHAESGMSSGIGGGRSTSDITVNINGGTVTTSGSGIGGGIYSDGVTVTINGGVIAANDKNGPGIGAAQTSGVEVFINGGSANGGVSVQPKNKDGEDVYLLQVENPEGKPVTVNGAEWNARNSAAIDGDTNLYMYVPAGKGTADVAIGDEPVKRWKLDEATKSFKVTSGVLYYNLTNGATEQRDATPVTAETTAWTGDNATGGWYAADDTVSVGQVTVSGNVNLILLSGKTLTAESIRIQNGGHLTVWAQGADHARWGVLNATGGIVTAVGGCGAITFNGGKISAAGSNGNPAIGTGGSGSDAQIEISAGLVTANGSGGTAIGAGTDADATVKIASGSVKATGGISPPAGGRARQSGVSVADPQPRRQDRYRQQQGVGRE